MSNLSPSKSNGGLVIRSQVKPETDYGKYRDHLRKDFWFSCNYCSTSEVEAGAQRFTIDHYEPRKYFPALESTYSNLLWSCGKCNEHKGDDVPTQEQRAAGHRFFRADVDRAREHFAIAGERINGLSNTGRFTEQLLYLNRLALRETRRRRAELQASQAEIVEGLRALAGVGIDRLRPDVRARFLRIRAELTKCSGKNDEELNERALQAVGRSVFVDSDPDRAEHAKERREYLNSIGALAPRTTKASSSTTVKLL